MSGERIGCGHYCSHGGICELPFGHEGQHDSGYCQWDSADSLTEEQADALLAESAGGSAYLRLKPLLQGLVGDEQI